MEVRISTRKLKVWLILVAWGRRWRPEVWGKKNPYQRWRKGETITISYNTGMLSVHGPLFSLSKGNLFFILDWEMCVTVRLSRDFVSSHCCVAGGTCPIAMSFHSCTKFEVSLAFFAGIPGFRSSMWMTALFYIHCLWIQPLFLAKPGRTQNQDL